MKIKINDNETYEFKLPEEIDAFTFLGLLNRLKSLKPLIENLELAEELKSNPSLPNSHRKKAYHPRINSKGITIFIRNNIKELTKMFYCNNALSPENQNKLRTFCENKNIPYNRNRLSISMNYVLHKLGLTKEQILNE